MTPPQSIREEIRRLGVIAAPLVAAYLAEYMMFLTTKLVVGGLGYKELAAAGLAGSLTFEAMVVAMGIVSITGVLVAQAEGRGNREEAGHAARQGLIVALILGLVLAVGIARLDWVLARLGQDPEIVALASPYLHWVAPVAPAALLFAALRNFCAALARTQMIMWITLSCVGMNWALTEGLVYGRWGLPEMGLAGAGLATALANWLMLGLLVAAIYRTPALRGYGLFRGRLRVDPNVIGEYFRLGFPVAGLVAVEAGLFSAVNILSGQISAEMLATHQVLMAWIGFPFMFAMAMAEAAMVRVALWAGRESPAGARRAGIVAMSTGTGFLILTMFVPILLAEEITAIFLPPETEGFAAVAATVSGLMILAALFQVFDGLQVIAARSLRGLKDAFAPLWIGAFGYWVLGIGSGWVLAFPLGYGGEGLWLGLAIGIFAAALMLAARFLMLTKRIGRQMTEGRNGLSATSS